MAYIDDNGKVLEGVEADLAEHKKRVILTN